MTRRSLFQGLLALPLLRFLEPLVRWLGPAEIYHTNSGKIPAGTVITAEMLSELVKIAKDLKPPIRPLRDAHGTEYYCFVDRGGAYLVPHEAHYR